MVICVIAGDQNQLKDIENRVLPTLTMDSREGSVAGPGGNVRLEPKVIAVLVLLARYSAHVVSRAELLDAVWPGVVVTEYTSSRCIYQLREQLGKVCSHNGVADYNPIETLPKRGYRLLATVGRALSDLRVAGNSLRKFCVIWLGSVMHRSAKHATNVHTEFHILQIVTK